MARLLFELLIAHSLISSCTFYDSHQVSLCVKDVRFSSAS